MQFNTGLQFDEIVGNGFLRDMEEVAQAGNWREVLPEAIIQATNREGKFYAVPVNIHGQSWLWYNAKVLADAAVEPPATFEEMIALGPCWRGRRGSSGPGRRTLAGTASLQLAS